MGGLGLELGLRLCSGLGPVLGLELGLGLGSGVMVMVGVRGELGAGVRAICWARVGGGSPWQGAIVGAQQADNVVLPPPPVVTEAANVLAHGGVPAFGGSGPL